MLLDVSTLIFYGRYWVKLTLHISLRKEQKFSGYCRLQGGAFMAINYVAKIFFIYGNCTHMRSNRLCKTCFDFIASMYNFSNNV